MLNNNCARTKEPLQLTFVCLSCKKKNTKKTLNNMKKRSISGFGFYSCSLNQTRKDYCVGRESNPGQLLGRQLCSPLYHRRFDLGIELTNVYFLWNLDRANFRICKSALIWNPLLIGLPPWSDQRPPSCPTFFRYEFSMFSDSHSLVNLSKKSW